PFAAIRSRTNNDNLLQRERQRRAITVGKSFISLFFHGHDDTFHDDVLAEHEYHQRRNGRNDQGGEHDRRVVGLLKLVDVNPLLSKIIPSWTTSSDFMRTVGAQKAISE